MSWPLVESLVVVRYFSFPIKHAINVQQILKRVGAVPSFALLPNASYHWAPEIRV